MKAKKMMIALSVLGMIQLSACGENYDDAGNGSSDMPAPNTIALDESDTFGQFIVQMPMDDLSDAEIEGLMFMREEEKLARDVYLTLYDKWGLLPFKNISKSEQVHMDAILSLLNKYHLDDPAEGSDIGTFANSELQNLYDELIARGSESAIEALKVGALIEEVDIIDLQKLIDEDVDNEDIEFVLANLKRASGFHLKAFVANLNRYNVAYSPELLDENTFIEIIN